jgi:hypothetical protein
MNYKIIDSSESRIHFHFQFENGLLAFIVLKVFIPLCIMQTKVYLNNL